MSRTRRIAVIVVVAAIGTLGVAGVASASDSTDHDGDIVPVFHGRSSDLLGTNYTSDHQYGTPGDGSYGDQYHNRDGSRFDGNRWHHAYNGNEGLSGDE
ncbi:MAG TPA: hypothetical protein VGM60_09605 [Pseudonocardia sp.]|jgi:hypothetical protein|uniref:hypothetical protein n=1 Tax=Pseudonocardia sp. TaxID=60912 RepID=UPI002F40C30C